MCSVVYMWYMYICGEFCVCSMYVYMFVNLYVVYVVCVYMHTHSNIFLLQKVKCPSTEKSGFSLGFLVSITKELSM